MLGFTLMNRILKSNSEEGPDIRQEHKIVFEMVKAIAESTKKFGTVIHAPISIHSPDVDEKMTGFLASFPNGDFMFWLNFDGELSLYSLVNEKNMHLFSCPNTELELLQAKLNELRPYFAQWD